MKSCRYLEQSWIDVLPEEEVRNIERIRKTFEASIEVEPIINKSTLKNFRSAYSYIMQKYKPIRNIKPCIAYVLINGISDGWRVNAQNIAFECLRVFDRDMSKAWELMKLYYENSIKKKSRTLSEMESAFKWVMKHHGFKVSCIYLSRNFPCVGSVEICNKIRGIKLKGSKDFYNMELVEGQELLYFKRLIYGKCYLRLSLRAMRIYLFLLQKTFETGFDVLYMPYREISKGIGIKDRVINRYLKELEMENLIAFTPGKPGLGSKTATEIKVLDVTGRAENRSEELFEEAFNE